MTLRGEIAGTAAIASVLLAFVHYLMQPAPIPVLAGVAGGLVGFWVSRRRRVAWASLGWLIGGTVGILGHSYSHWSEGRMGEPVDGIVSHLVRDGSLGMLVAALTLILCLLAFRAVAERSAE